MDRDCARSWGASATFVAAWAATAGAITLTPLEQERGVFTEAVSAAASAFQEDFGPDEVSDFSPFASSVGSSAASSDASADAWADTDSSLGPEALEASGAASAAALAAAGDARGRAPADSFFQVSFEIDAAQTLGLLGHVASQASGSDADAWSRIELVDESTGSALVSHEVGPGGDVWFTQEIALAAGTPYRLTATSLAHAEAVGSAAGSSGDASHAVYLPEPGRALQLAAGLAGLALLAGRRAQAARRAEARR